MGLKSDVTKTEDELLENCEEDYEEASTRNIIFKLQKLFIKIYTSPQKCKIFEKYL